MFKLLLLLSVVQAFLYKSFYKASLLKTRVYVASREHDAGGQNSDSVSTFLERMLSFIFEALPAAMAPLTITMDETKIIKNPPKFIKAATISDLRKKHQKESLWATQDIIDKFASKYLPEVSPGDIKVLLVNTNDVYASYPEAIEEQLNTLDMNPIAAAEKFIADGIVAAAAPLDKPMDSSKMHSQPKRFVKPLQQSQLRKALDKDPDYFK